MASRMAIDGPLDERSGSVHVEASRHLNDVLPEAGKKDVPLEMAMVDLALELLPERPVADDDEPGVGDRGHDPRGGGDEAVVALVGIARSHVADDWRVGWEPELPVDVGDGRALHAFDVDAGCHDGDV